MEVESMKKKSDVSHIKSSSAIHSFFAIDTNIYIILPKLIKIIFDRASVVCRSHIVQKRLLGQKKCKKAIFVGHLVDSR